MLSCYGPKPLPEPKMPTRRAHMVELQASHETAQQSHSRELLQRSEELDARQGQAHAHVAELQNAHEQAMQNHSRELDQENDASDARQKQLLQAQAQVNQTNADVDSLQKTLSASLVEADDLQAAKHHLQQKHDREMSQRDDDHSREVLQKNHLIDSLQIQLQQVRAQLVELQSHHEKAQHKYSRELLQKTEEIDTHQIRLRKAHAHVAELQNAQEQAQQNYSRELDQKNDTSANLQKQLLQAQAQANQKTADADAIQKQLNAALVEADDLQAAKQNLQQTHDQEIVQRDEEICALSRRAQQVCASMREDEIAQERLRENHFREVSQKDARIDSLHKQLEHAREESALAARRFEEAMESESHNAEKTISCQRETIRELEAQLAAATQPPSAKPASMTPPTQTPCHVSARANQENANAGAVRAGGHKCRSAQPDLHVQNDSHWTCPKCDEMNNSSRAICNNCGGPRCVACIAASPHSATLDPRTASDVSFKHPKVSLEGTLVANQDNENAGAVQAGGHVWRRRDSLWTCRICDEVNKSSRAICNNCEVPRSVARVAVPSHSTSLEPPTSSEVPFKRPKVSQEDTQ